MWDPRRYVDTDFGLGESDAFEPVDEPENEWAEIDGPYVMTVLGPIPPDDLGVCQHFEHVSPLRDDPLAFRAVADELEAYFTVGGRAMVDIPLADRPQDPAALRRLSQLVPVHLIAAIRVDPDSSVDSVERDIGDGFEGSGIRPGLLVASPGAVALASQAARASGCPLLLTVPGPSDALGLVESALREGIRPDGVIAGGFADTPMLEQALSVVETGVYLSLDRVGQAGPQGDQAIAQLAVALHNAGYGDRILLSQRLGDRRQFASQGGRPGWIHLLERFALDILEAGGDAMLVRQMLMDNQAAALSMSSSSDH